MTDRNQVGGWRAAVRRRRTRRFRPVASTTRPGIAGRTGSAMADWIPGSTALRSRISMYPARHLIVDGPAKRWDRAIWCSGNQGSKDYNRHSGKLCRGHARLAHYPERRRRLVSRHTGAVKGCEFPKAIWPGGSGQHLDRDATVA
jgi:hypothetical protein